jgi:RecA/RadA recombinase
MIIQEKQHNDVAATVEDSAVAQAQPNTGVINGGKSPSYVTGWDIFNMPLIPHHFFLDGLIPLHTLTLLCGPSDTGKSLFARQVAVATALGRTSVGGFKLNAKYSKAVYVSTEDGIHDWQDKLSKYGLSEEEKKKLVNLTLILENDSDTLKVLEDRISKDPVDLIVIDVLTDIFNQDINDAIKVRVFLAKYNKLARRYGCTVLFIHHLSKKGEAGLPSKTNVLGSQGIESRMRSVLELRGDDQNPDYRYLAVTKSNYLPQSQKKQLYKLLLKPSLEFEFQGDRVNASQLIRSKPTTPLPVLRRVVELHSQGKSIRQIEQQLAEEGLKLGRSRIHEIISQQSADNDSSPVE